MQIAVACICYLLLLICLLMFSMCSVLWPDESSDIKRNQFKRNQNYFIYSNQFIQHPSHLRHPVTSHTDLWPLSLGACCLRVPGPRNRPASPCGFPRPDPTFVKIRTIAMFSPKVSYTRLITSLLTTPLVVSNGHKTHIQPTTCQYERRDIIYNGNRCGRALECAVH